MRVRDIKGKKLPILVIVVTIQDSHWVKFLRSMMKLQSLSSTFLSKCRLASTKQSDSSAQIMERNSSTKLCLNTMKVLAYFIKSLLENSQQKQRSSELRNRTLVEAARTMMIFSKAPMFLWAEAVATACYTHNRSLIHTRHNKTPYELVHDKKPDLTFLRVFGALCYPTNDSEDLGKFQAKADIGIFVGYAPSRKGYRIYTRETRRLMENNSRHIRRMASEDGSCYLENTLNSLVNEQVPSAMKVNAHVAPHVRIMELRKTTHEDSNQSMMFYSFCIPVTGEPGSVQSSSRNVNSAEPYQVNQPPDHLKRWTKDHPLDNIVGNPSRPVSTRKQLASDALWSCFYTELSKVEPKNFKMVMIEDCWFQAMQDEIHEFDHLEVWEFVPRPIYVMVIALKWIYKVKLDEYGDVLKNKARLVAKGYRQEEGIDFEESFAPVA
ncbi:integrase, catalytic region, zinc finger, CCHC-type containing protein [Tanacetum coccineum]